MKLKKQKQVIDANCTDEMTEADQKKSHSEGNNNRSVELVPKSGSKEEATSLKFGSGLKTAESAGDECDLIVLGELAVSGSENDSNHSDMLPSKQLSSNAVFNCSSSKKVKNMQVQECVTQGRVRPARVRPAQVRPARVRPAQVPPARVQPARNCKSSDMEANKSPDITGRRSKRLRKSADDYKRQDLGSPSNNNISSDRNSEEDPDKHLPPMKRARFRMGYLYRPSSAEEQINGQVEDKQPPLSEIRNNQPFSGLVDVEAALPPSKPRDRALEAISVNAAQDSQRSSDGPAVTKTSVIDYCSSSSSECTKATLDSKEGAEIGSTKVESLNEHFVHSDASVAEVSGKPLEEVPASCISPVNLTYEACKDAKEALDCVGGNQNVKIQAPELDGAALSPSKLHHCALEAISVNAAQGSRRSSDGLTVTKTSINEYCSSSSSGECDKATLENKEGAEVGSTKLESLNEHFVHSDESVAEVIGKPMEEVPTSCIPPSDLTHKACKDAKEDLDCGDGEQDVKVQGPRFDERGTSLEGLQGSPLLVMQLSNDSKPENAQLPKRFTEPEAQISKSSDLVSQEDYSPTSSWRCANSMLSSAEDNSFGTTELCQPSLPSAEKCGNSHLSSAEDNYLGTIEEKQNNSMSGIEKEDGSAIKNPNAISSPAPAKVLIAAHQGQNLSDSSNIPDDQLRDKAVSTIQSSSTVTKGVASVTRASTLGIATRYMSSIPNNNYDLGGNSSCFTLGGHPHVDKPILAEKWSSQTESDMALASFEANLGSLNESNESISGATLVAIDCLKLGVATKVVEILTRELEIEKSLHRKMNLFHLVDSITQYSRRIEGDLSGIYPSAVGAVLPRLLLAAAPPSSTYLDNSWQCLRVLKIWQQENIIRQSIIEPHIRELDLRCCSYSGGGFPHSLGRKSAFDQYKSNSGVQLSSTFASPLPKDRRPSSNPLAVLRPPPPLAALPPRVQSLSNTQVGAGAFHIRPAHYARTNQFSYVQADQQRQPPPPYQSLGTIQVANGAFQSRPPHFAPINQFSYVQADQQTKSARPVQSMSNIQGANGAFQARPPHRAPRIQFSSGQADQQRQSPPPVQSSSNIKVADGALQLRPPNNAPTDQFSYVLADQRSQSRWDILPHPIPNRPPAAPVSDPTMQPNGPYLGHPPTKPALPFYMRDYRPQEIRPTQDLPQRPPPPGGPFPEASKGPTYWRPR